jgi:hypothetical protein
MGACTKVVEENAAITEMAMTGGIARKGAAVKTERVSCFCGSSVVHEVWPVRVCGTLMCPNEKTVNDAAIKSTGEEKRRLSFLF